MSEERKNRQDAFGGGKAGDTSTKYTHLDTVNSSPLAFKNYETRLKITAGHFQMAFPKPEINRRNGTPVMAQNC